MQHSESVSTREQQRQFVSSRVEENLQKWLSQMQSTVGDIDDMEAQ
jgi:hypothetical protein